MKSLNKILSRFRDYLLGSNLKKLKMYQVRIYELERQLDYEKRQYSKLNNQQSMLLSELYLLRTLLKSDTDIKKY